MGDNERTVNDELLGQRDRLAELVVEYQALLEIYRVSFGKMKGSADMLIETVETMSLLNSHLEFEVHCLNKENLKYRTLLEKHDIKYD